jgi:ribosome-binding ATPase YchF (GTP1/OBG family)
MKDKSFSLNSNCTHCSGGLQLCINHDVFLHVEGTREDEFKLLSFIWMFKVQIINDTLPRLITTKPMIYLLNLTEKAYLTKKNNWLNKTVRWINEHGGGMIIPISVDFEERLAENADESGDFSKIKLKLVKKLRMRM